MSEKDKKEKTIIIKESNNSSREDKVVAFTIGGSILLTVLLVLLFIFIPRWINKGYKYSSGDNTSSSYVINEDTEEIYNNMKSYINSEIDDLGLGFKNAEEFTSIKFNDHHLTLTYITSDNPGYVDITMPEQDSMSSALTSFIDEPPILGAYGITISDETYGDEVVVHLNDKDINVKTSVKDTHKYVSLMTMKDDSTISVISHEEYLSSGIYKYIDVTPNSDKVFFDFLYYLIH